MHIFLPKDFIWSLSEFSRKPHQSCIVLLNLKQFLQALEGYIFIVFYRYRKFLFSISTFDKFSTLTIYILLFSLFPSLLSNFSDDELLHFFLHSPVLCTCVWSTRRLKTKWRGGSGFFAAGSKMCVCVCVCVMTETLQFTLRTQM